MIKKHKKALVSFFFIHLISSIILFFPLGMSFGHSNFAKLLLILTRFPIDYKSIKIYLFWLPLIVNTLFWTLIFLSIIVVVRLIKKTFL